MLQRSWLGMRKELRGLENRPVWNKSQLKLREGYGMGSSRHTREGQQVLTDCCQQTINSMGVDQRLDGGMSYKSLVGMGELSQHSIDVAGDLSERPSSCIGPYQDDYDDDDDDDEEINLQLSQCSSYWSFYSERQQYFLKPFNGIPRQFSSPFILCGYTPNSAHHIAPLKIAYIDYGAASSYTFPLPHCLGQLC